MFGKRIELFKLFGFSVKVDLSWVAIALLVTWSLAKGYFPANYPDLPAGTYWAMGVVGMLGLFVSIVLHELSHSLAARQFGMPMKGITLFIFGGVAEMDEEPPSAKAEFVMAIAGPIASVVIALICLGVNYAGGMLNWPALVNGVFGYLALINTVLVIFNMIPAFPLDGGRVFRAALWHWKGSIRKATRITSTIGSGFGMFLIFFGVLMLFTGNLIGGIWMALIGMFLRGAAQMSYQQLLVRRALEGETVSRFMNPEPVTIPPDISLDDLVENYIYRHHFKMFPVVEDGRLQGCVTTRDVRNVPREQWSGTTTKDVTQPCSEANTISYDADAMQALSRMSQADNSRAMVVRDGHLEGILSLKDMMKFLSLKIELEEDGDDSLPLKQQSLRDADDSFTEPPRPTVGSGR